MNVIRNSILIFTSANLLLMSNVAISQKKDVAQKEASQKAPQIKERREATAAERAAEDKRLREYDKPVREDPIGNALIGGAVTGVLKGGAAAGAQSAVKGAATGTATQRAKEATKGKVDAGARTTNEGSANKSSGPREKPSRDR